MADSYAIGLSALSELVSGNVARSRAQSVRIGDDTDGPLGFFATPAQQQERLRNVGTLAEMLARDVRAYEPPPAQQAAWSTWLANFETWLTAFRAFQPDWLDRGFSSTARQIEQYARELGNLRADFALWPNAKPTAPSPTELQSHEEKQDDKDPSWAEPAKVIAIVLGVSVVAVAAINVFGGRRG